MKYSATLISTIFVCLVLAGVSWADEKCTKCHSDKARGKSVHPAVAAGCRSCHIGVDASEVPHKFVGASKGLPSTGVKLCMSCHDRKKFLGRRTVHNPVASGMCTSCHDPHSSKFNALLLSDNVCFNCHDKGAVASKKSVHPPVLAGMCTGCHDPHQSKYPSLLSSTPPKLCFSCHSKDAFTGDVVHVPVALGACNSCHEPHQSDHLKLATGGVSEVCFSCHEARMVLRNPVHSGVGENMCIQCHNPHASKNKSLLR